MTLRLRRGLPTLRAPIVAEMFARVFREVSRDGFAVAHHSLQRDHVHLVVEAQDRKRLSSGVRRLVIRAARRLNLLLGRAGGVWGDRYHRRDLTTPREVRNALVYVLANAKRHGLMGASAGLDPYSSACHFDGWMTWPGAALPAWLPPTGPPPPPVPPPRTWLLRVGWRRHGLLSQDVVPASARRR